MVKTEIYLYKDDPSRNWGESGTKTNKSQFIHVMQGEANAERLEFHLFQSPTQPIDLTETTVTFYLTKPDGQIVYLPADVSSGTEGIAAVTLTGQCTAVSGIAEHAEVRVTSDDGSVLKFSAPSLFIRSSHTENAIESTSEFHALDLALSKVDGSLRDAASAADSAQAVLSADRQVLTDASNAAQDAHASADAANQAASSATDAASAANSATTAATSAASAANSAAASAGTAALSCESAISDMAATAQTEVNKHALRTDNPHSVTAAQVGAAVCTIAQLTPLNGWTATYANIAKVGRVVTLNAQITGGTVSRWTRIFILPAAFLPMQQTEIAVKTAQSTALKTAQIGLYPDVFIDGTDWQSSDTYIIAASYIAGR